MKCVDTGSNRSQSWAYSIPWRCTIRRVTRHNLSLRKDWVSLCVLAIVLFCGGLPPAARHTYFKSLMYLVRVEDVAVAV